MHFLSRIKNPLRIKDIFGFFKQFRYFPPIHLFEIWRTDKTIIVLTGDRSFVFGNNCIHLIRNLRNCFSYFWIFDINKWDDVEISIPYMPLPCKKKFWMFSEDISDFFKYCCKIMWINNN